MNKHTGRRNSPDDREPWFEREPTPKRRSRRPKADDKPKSYGRNTIIKLGPPPTRDYACLPNDVARHGIETDTSRGGDAVRVLLYLCSQRPGWQTSAEVMQADLRMGSNGTRVAAALRALEADRRLVQRPHIRIGGGRQSDDYVFHTDGTRLTDAEIQEWTQPVKSEGRGSRKRRER